MRVVYFSKTSARGPTSRYRVYQYLPYLQTGGIDCRVYPLFGDAYFAILEIQSAVFRLVAKVMYVAVRFLKRGVELLTVTGADLVVIEGQLFPYLPPTVERLMAALGCKLVFEFDDAIYLTWGHRRKVPALLKLSTGVIVGNAHLAQYVRAHTPRVSIIPTVVDTLRFQLSSNAQSRSARKADEKVTIVWIGLAYNFSYLNPLVPVLKRLQADSRVRFLVISSHAPELPGVEVDFRHWRLESEAKDLQACHIGIMPLPDDEWARGKCALKLLQYMAVGLPAVASPVGVNREIISDGENGFLAVTEHEWRDKLLRLCEDSVLRHRMGYAARKSVEEKYSLQSWGPRLAKLYEILARNASPEHHADVVVEPLSR